MDKRIPLVNGRGYRGEIKSKRMWSNRVKIRKHANEIRKKTNSLRSKIEGIETQIYQLFHNYIREHEALNGKTPAEKCGIKIEGKNKWMTLIQNSKTTK